PSSEPARSSPMRKLLLVLTTMLVGAAVICGQFVTVFVIQPIGIVPEGKTLVISRLTTMNFIDSADAWCERETGRVNLLCRAVVMGRVAQQTTVLARLPYSSALYVLSTGGKTYDR